MPANAHALYRSAAAPESPHTSRHHTRAAILRHGTKNHTMCEVVDV
ncbi:MAG: hypothetical protein HY033_04790 [Ignavibacteriae bacterium]|nr:hypothetical protein [Ignavibacteria bacterium]MBI3364206.1 hypothetical protein [Ignavibacteriota bacterium]